MYLSKENHQWKEQYQLAHNFPVRVELALTGILSANRSFQDGEMLIFFKIGLYSKVEQTNVSL
jgi:hypothetical protein